MRNVSTVVLEIIRLWSAQQGRADGPSDEQMGSQEEKAEVLIQNVDTPLSKSGEKEQ